MSSDKQPGESADVQNAKPSPGGDAGDARRRLVKALVGSGSILAAGKMLPEEWTRPVVESVVLPAHAQATGTVAGLFSGDLEILGPGPAASNPAPGSSILDFFVSPAHAQNGLSCNVVTSLLISVSGSQAKMCLGTMVGNFKETTTVSGLNLADVSIEGIGFTNMQAAANGQSISGNSECGPFLLNKIGGSFSCPTNVTSFFTLTGGEELA
jgi:hypothetical protein